MSNAYLMSVFARFTDGEVEDVNVRFPPMKDFYCNALNVSFWHTMVNLSFFNIADVNVCFGLSY